MIENKPALTIKDNIFGTNIIPAGVMCITPSNPAVSAAMGAPQPCVPPPFAGPWKPGTMSCKIKGMGILDNTCMLNCVYGGMITILNPGTTKVTAN